MQKTLKTFCIFASLFVFDVLIGMDIDVNTGTNSSIEAVVM